MEVHIADEYVVRRRWEKSAREAVAGGGGGGGGVGERFSQRKEERKFQRSWTAPTRGIEVKKSEISFQASDKGKEDLFGCFSP